MISQHRFVFLGISAACLAAHNILMIVTDWVGVPLLGSILVSFTVATLLGYFGHSFMTFGQPLSINGLGRYSVGMMTAVAIAVPVIWFWKVAMHLPMIIASPAASLCTVGINFALTRWAIVRPVASTGSTL
jgi:putative flippase GtrA